MRIFILMALISMGANLHAESLQNAEVLDGSAGLILRLENAERRIQLLTDALDRLNGAVVSFEATTCPEGWMEYEAARGRFVRGIDADGVVDPDGVRPPGSLQEDSIVAHAHSAAVVYEHNQSFKNDGKGRKAVFQNHNKPQTGVYGGAETRPKNVSLLYCTKDASSDSLK